MNLVFDFTVDKANNTIHITREFAADQDLVWDAFTRAEILEQWMAPKPLTVKTREMDFRVGGRWLYAMVSPEKVIGWSLMEFLEIDPKTSFTTRNSFCDENGNPGERGLSFSITKHSFEPADGKTTVRIEKKMASLAELEKFVAMGYKDGMGSALSNLDALLSAMVVKK